MNVMEIPVGVTGELAKLYVIFGLVAELESKIRGWNYFETRDGRLHIVSRPPTHPIALCGMNVAEAKYRGNYQGTGHVCFDCIEELALR